MKALLLSALLAGTVVVPHRYRCQEEPEQDVEFADAGVVELVPRQPRPPKVKPEPQPDPPNWADKMIAVSSVAAAALAALALGYTVWHDNRR